MDFQQLGPYRLGRKIGQGGMGSVYEGTDVVSGESAAIKVLNPVMAAQEGFRARFEAEIDSLKKLKHPHIVRLYGYGEEQGTLFYAMELASGLSLEDELRAGRRFEWREVTRIAIDLCRALKQAHDNGVIHRDIKPANLLLSQDGSIKLSDFGIARLFGNTRMTSDGGVLGTAEYMAPEQADGRLVTDRCDQYSLGGVMYALLSGRAPFRANTLLEMLQLQRFAEPQPVRRYAPQTPAELERIIAQLLEKDPQKRFSNMLILARALEAMEHGLSLPANRPDFVVSSPDLATADVTSIDPLAATLVPADLDLPPAGGTEQTFKIQRTPGTLTPLIAKSSPEPEPPVHFTKVEQAESAVMPWYREGLERLVAGPTLALVGGLLLLGGAAWYALQPATADQLYARIETAVADGRVDAADNEITQFLNQFPSDDRVGRVQAWQEDTELNKLERRSRREGLRRGRQAVLTSVERAYLEAMHVAELSPDSAIVKFQAIVDLYGDSPPGESPLTQKYVKLAERQLKRLGEQVAIEADDSKQALELRVKHARDVSTADPAAAARMWRAIETLYGDKPWAEDAVAAARAALKQLETSTSQASDSSTAKPPN